MGSGSGKTHLEAELEDTCWREIGRLTKKQLVAPTQPVGPGEIPIANLEYWDGAVKLFSLRARYQQRLERLRKECEQKLAGKEHERLRAEQELSRLEQLLVVSSQLFRDCLAELLPSGFGVDFRKGWVMVIIPPMPETWTFTHIQKMDLSA